MRTTVEIKPEHRSSAIGLGITPQTKGFSAVLSEAIESFLHGEAEREKSRKALLSLGGSLSEKEGDELRQTAKRLRESWR